MGAAAPWHDDLSLWRTGVERAPTSARAFTGLSRALRNRGDLDAADAALTRAIALDPTFLRARVAAVYNAFARGDVEAARRAIEAVDRGGGSTQQGMKRARRCAALPQREAMACAGYAPDVGAGNHPVETTGAL